MAEATETNVGRCSVLFWRLKLWTKKSKCIHFISFVHLFWVHKASIHFVNRLISWIWPVFHSDIHLMIAHYLIEWSQEMQSWWVKNNPLLLWRSRHPRGLLNTHQCQSLLHYWGIWAQRAEPAGWMHLLTSVFHNLLSSRPSVRA